MLRGPSYLARVAFVGALLSGAGALLSIEQGCSEAPPKASKPEPIVIGVSLGLTKDLETFSAPLRDAIRVAEGEINANGGLLGRPIEFDIVDDQSNEGDLVKEIANRFVEKRVVAVIGPLGSEQVRQTHDIFKNAQILQLAPSATSTDLEGLQPIGDRWLYRTTPDDAFQGAAVMLFGTRTPRGIGDAGAPPGDGGVASTCSKMAIVNIENSYGEAMANVIEENWKNRPPAGTRSISIRKKVSTDLKSDYVQEASDVIATSPDCLCLITYEQAGAQFVKDFTANAGYKALTDKGFFFIGTDGVFASGFIKGTLADQSDPSSKSVVETNMFGTNPDTQPLSPEYREFRTIYASYFPLRQEDEAPPFASNAFDAAMLMAFAIQKAGTVDDRVKIRDALKDVARPPGRPISPRQIGEALVDLRNGLDIDYKGASGPVDLEDNGNVSGGFIVWEVFRNTISNRVEFRTVDRYATAELQEQFK